MTFRNPKRTRSSGRITPALLSVGLLGASAPAWAVTPATFAAPVESSTGPGPRYVAAADFNKDGVPDGAIVNSANRTLAIQLGSRTGCSPRRGRFPCPRGKRSRGARLRGQ